MKRFIISLLVCLPMILFAQTDGKYLEGAVPQVNGKVTFTTAMNVGTMSKEQIFETLLTWANKRFQPTDKFKARVLYSNPEDGNIVINGDEFIVFSSTALALDRTRIYYHLTLSCQTGKCDITMNRIRYWYEEDRNGGEKYTAEEWITDEIALKKDKTKLYPICGKFRRKTIDLKDELFKDIQSVLGQKMIDMGLQAAPVTPESQVKVTQPQVAQTNQAVAATTVVSQPVPTTVPAAQSQDTESLINQAIRMTITAGNDEQFEISKECWGGFGELFGKKVTFCLIDTQKTMGNMLMEQSDNYKISFYTANNSQPVVSLNCKKLMAQTINGEEAQKMSPNCTIEKSYNMYVGEILK